MAEIIYNSDNDISNLAEENILADDLDTSDSSSTSMDNSTNSTIELSEFSRPRLSAVLLAVLEGKECLHDVIRAFESQWLSSTHHATVHPNFPCESVDTITSNVETFHLEIERSWCEVNQSIHAHVASHQEISRFPCTSIDLLSKLSVLRCRLMGDECPPPTCQTAEIGNVVSEYLGTLLPLRRFFHCASASIQSLFTESS